MAMWTSSTSSERLQEEYIKPEEYLEFAKLDIKNNNLHSAINALGNIKRAVDSQLDIILERFGLLKLSIDKQWSFPQKVDTIKKLGIVSPDILKKINLRRIDVEHYHKKPNINDVKELLDVAELFIALCYQYKNFVHFYLDEQKGIAILIDRNKSIIKIYKNTEHDFNQEAFRGKIEDLEKIKPTETILTDDMEKWIDICKNYLMGYSPFR